MEDKVEKLVRTIIEEGLTYSSEYSEVEDAVEVGPGRYRCSVTISSAPRDANEFLQEGDSDYTIDLDTEWMDSESSPVESIIRCGFHLTRAEDAENEDVETYEIFEKFDCDNVTILFCGHHSCPSYSDDEGDAYFSGDVYVEFDGSGWALKKTKENIMAMFEAHVTSEMAKLSAKIQTLRDLGYTDQVGKDHLLDLVRKSVIG